MAHGGIKGIGDIPTNGSVMRSGSNGAQNAHRLARMQHQKSLLEKQLAVWTLKKATTERRLRQLEEEIGEVLASFGRSAHGAKPGAARRKSEKGGPDSVPKRQEVAFEF